MKNIKELLLSTICIHVTANNKSDKANFLKKGTIKNKSEYILYFESHTESKCNYYEWGYSYYTKRTSIFSSFIQEICQGIGTHHDLLRSCHKTSQSLFIKRCDKYQHCMHLLNLCLPTYNVITFKKSYISNYISR